MNAAAPLRWDIFCQVIDNYGDIGVCWRLAADLAGRGQRVRLWVDNASALAWMAPGGAPGVQVMPWPTQAPAGGLGDVVVEAFGCEIAPAVVAAIAQRAQAPGAPPVWINLEYLSAEGYVERCHALPSPVLSGPGAGLVKHFFYPGFTAGTGGLLREPDLAERQARFDRSAWRAQHGLAPAALAVSLFCYEPAALPALLALLAQTEAETEQPVHLLTTPGRAAAAVRALVGSGEADENIHGIGLQPNTFKREKLSISYLPSVPQAQFDQLLWGCNLNFVRGEDSLVRALWAGRPFVWQIYPQSDLAHQGKLHAFLDWLQAPPSLRCFHVVWNGLDSGALPALDPATLAQWAACTQAARARLLTQDNLVTQLLGFVAKKR
ncbi:hypothetical protein B2J86_08265 [Acidovorax sp. SRB_14]|uniref:elongation factor P maturation arginine rhamnosyltransferase EarP n=1 Tax=Acidovorax sp. SRB_14 TaxID=1962699 RepID=UPI001564D277|nr:elongation factor P maturation arginine rhamnosyltransferase EarP [Acidovorax sp. SRB_14]NMM80916.1 hypothetical protein [Acidovorax sp. SRB_14]